MVRELIRENSINSWVTDIKEDSTSVCRGWLKLPRDSTKSTQRIESSICSSNLIENTMYPKENLDTIHH